MKAGLMRKCNFGALHKVKWSRSSRTDKGVHSCATVVSLKVNCDKDSWDTDPEGTAYVQAINKCAVLPHDCLTSRMHSRQHHHVRAPPAAWCLPCSVDRP